MTTHIVQEQQDLGWWNVAGSSIFVLFTGNYLRICQHFNHVDIICSTILAYLSHLLGIQLEISLIVSSLRCILQLTLMVCVCDHYYQSSLLTSTLHMLRLFQGPGIK